MITLAFSTNAYTKFSLPDACDRIAAAGYKAVEVLADAPHAYPPEYSDHEAGRLKERLDALGLRCVAINGNTAMGYFKPFPRALTFEPSLLSPVEVRRQDRLAIIRRALALANRLGAPVVTITTGQPLSGEPSAVLGDRLREGLEQVVRAADLAGILYTDTPPGGETEPTTESVPSCSLRSGPVPRHLTRPARS
jgi:sugar phosphate isomerase/epimerase